MQVANNPKSLSSRYRVQGCVLSAAKFLVAVLLLYSSGNAAESPTSDWQVEWQRVMAAARKEGKVVVSVPPGAELRKALKKRLSDGLGSNWNW
jgi:hypothetical protein